jgi:hypothetical protein
MPRPRLPKGRLELSPAQKRRRPAKHARTKASIQPRAVAPRAQLGDGRLSSCAISPDATAREATDGFDAFVEPRQLVSAQLCAWRPQYRAHREQLARPMLPMDDLASLIRIAGQEIGSSPAATRAGSEANLAAFTRSVRTRGRIQQCGDGGGMSGRSRRTTLVADPCHATKFLDDGSAGRSTSAQGSDISAHVMLAR